MEEGRGLKGAVDNRKHDASREGKSRERQSLNKDGSKRASQRWGCLGGWDSKTKGYEEGTCFLYKPNKNMI